MGIRFASWAILLYLLVTCTHGDGAMEMTKEHHNPENKHTEMQDVKGTNVLRLHSMDGKNEGDTDVHKGIYNSQHDMDGHQKIHVEQDDDAHQETHTNHVHNHPSSHMDHIDPSALVFFTMNDLKVGKKMAIYFRKTDPTNSPHLLPREEADSIPFSSKALPHLLQLFSFSQSSPQAKAMEDTLRQCELKPIKGETKFCATSLESMLDFTRGIFGLDSQFKAITTTHLTKSTTLFQNYTVLDVPKRVLASNMVACHTLPYPYAVFYCHCQESENKVFKVSLGGENGDRVEAVAVCHMDTSHWSRNHASFRVLGVEPGTSPVCHFFHADNFIWVPTPTLDWY
ncbi:hypothetical protein L1049_015867 [Liquidambar formosana]|uniref:BURP domain-containing protein n=1 Tax=Liquidambar formosana TaxID=63359 RepID=A0AAP0S4B3_LIQFO